MSEMRWKDLRDTDFGPLKSLVDQFGTYINASIEQTEVVTEDVVKKHLSVENYESQTADDIRAQANMLADSFQDDLHEYAAVKIKATLEDAHAELTAAQTDMNDLLATMAGKYKVTGPADDHGLTISDELAAQIEDLRPPAEIVERAGLAEEALANSSSKAYAVEELIKAAEAEAEEFAGVLRAIMTRAHNAEETAAGILTSIIDDPAEQPPPLGATYDDLIDDYKTENAERNAEFLQELASGESEATPHGVNEWWNGLSDEERTALLEDHPELIGGLDGIPSDTRNDVNRNLLDSEIDDLEAQLEELREQEILARRDPEADNGALMAQIDELEHRLNNLESLDSAISGSALTGQEYYLLDFDSAEDGKAIVSIGNPDTADNTGVYVPGTGTRLDDIGGSVNRAEVMAWESHRAAPDEETAIVMWFDFDSPDSPVSDSPSLSYAKDAAPALASFTDGLEATNHAPERTTTTVVGHSYGTTVVGEASREYGLETDQMMAVASPGVNTGSVDELNIEGDDFYATTNDNDIIQAANLVDIRQDDDDWTGLGPDPTSGDFGGNVFTSDSMTESQVDAHSTYWDEGNQARRDMGLILTGQGAQSN